MIEWPDDLVSDIARRKCVIYIGSGVSMNSCNAQGKRPRTWWDLLNYMMERMDNPKNHINKLLKENDYLTACELIKSRLGRDRFVRIIREEFLTPSYKAAKIHEELFKLDSRLTITPNFDKIYETYALSQTNGSTVVKYQYDNDIQSAIREDGRLIIKAHGSIDSPEKLIFTRNEYAKARTNNRHFYEILEALSLTHTFIFIGCGVNDPDIRLLLEDAFFKHNSYRPHFMLMPRGILHSEHQNVIEESMNLKILNYSKNNNHSELTESLSQLVSLVEDVREELRENGNW